MNPEKPKYCDMVMKGGITSGVVYPTAICELATQYQFRNIGGASAGAIAAAAAAAAEFGRQNGVADSFTQLGKLPEEFGSPGFLPTLFTPDGNTHAAYKTFLGVLAAKPGAGRIVSLVVGLLGQYWQSALIGAAIAALFVAGVIQVGGVAIDSLRQRFAIGVLALLWIIAGVALVVVSRVILQTTRAIVDNGFGLSNGLSTKAAGSAPLTNWMYALFNRLAGLPSSRPLVFADLWKGRVVKEDDVIDLTEERRINLEVVTTNLNHLSPYTVPFKNDTFYFDPEEWALLFPREVVSWMKTYAAEVQRQVDLFLSPGGRYDELIRAILVLVDGEPIVEHYGKNGSPQTTSDIFSVTKSVMSMLIGIAIGDGQIGSVDQTLGELLPSYAAVMAPGVADITLRQVLTMTGGIVDDTHQIGASALPDDWISAIVSTPLQSPPGTSFAYSSFGSHLLSAILVQATGRSVLDYAREKLLGPLGISTEPAAKHDAHIQLCIGTEAIVTPKVEQAARVLCRSQRVGSRWGGHRCSGRDRPAAVLQLGVHVPPRPRILGVRARVESQLGRRDVKRSVIDERIVAPRSIAIKDREWILQISRRPSLVAV